MSIDNKAIKNILAVRNDRFGEFLLNIPSFRALKETFINARLIVLIDPYLRELAESIPFIDEIIEWDRRRHSLLAKIYLMNLLKRKNIDIAVMLNPAKELNIFTYLAGIPVRVGYNRKWGFLLTHKMEDKKYLGDKHEIEYNLELVNLIGAKTKDKSLSLIIDNNINNSLLEDFHKESYETLIALHPWTSDPIKQWPKERFCDLAKRLSQDLKVKVAIIGSNDKSDKDLGYYNNIGDNIINIIGKTTLKQLAALLKKCKLLISGDSGPVHLACAVGTPVIAIFRSDIKGKNAKRWGPSLKGSIVIEKDNLYDIDVDVVLEKTKEALRI